MATAAIVHKHLSVAEYLRLEEAASERHEYVGGLLRAMVGVSKRHARILSNIIAVLLPEARALQCDVFASDVKLQVSADAIYYPDIAVVCDPTDTDPYIMTKPCLIVEILSPSTHDIDRHEKLLSYLRLPALQSYVIVHQDEPRIEQHWRDAHGDWWQTDLRGEGTIDLPCPACSLTLEQVYRGVMLTA